MYFKNDIENKFEINKETEAKVKEVVDFLSSFSIENRMGLKILIDKWLLQQSLFRGKYTKIARYLTSHPASWLSLDYFFSMTRE